MNIALTAKHNRKYPPIKSGSTVRVLLKPSTFKKSWHDRWSPETYKVYGVQGRYYLVNDNKQKVYLRHELLLVDWKWILIKPNLKWHRIVINCLGPFYAISV